VRPYRDPTGLISEKMVRLRLPDYSGLNLAHGVS
jgi:hypothetical protein